MAFSILKGKKPEELFGSLPTPCYIIDEAGLKHNGQILKELSKKTGCKILLAQKAFSNYDFYPLLSDYLAGTEASGLYEARLGKECMPDREVHVFCAAYSDREFEEIMKYADHIVFNSPAQLKRFGKKAKEGGKSIGLRINPACSTQEGHDIYDPCSPTSRLGTTREVWDDCMTEELISLLDGLHFHTLCEQNSDALLTTVNSFTEQFADIMPRMKWLNMGGGHHITKRDYDISLLEKIIGDIRKKWSLEVYLEPGEAVALNAGFLACRVLDMVRNKGNRIAILDVSAACHMPDVIEMPYMPPLYGAVPHEDHVDKEAFTCILAGPTCLAGDVVGAYDFAKPLQIGDMLLFGDLAIYSTCKNNTFNGMALPDIWRKDLDGRLEKLTDFDYDDFKMRLGKYKKTH